MGDADTTQAVAAQVLHSGTHWTVLQALLFDKTCHADCAAQQDMQC
jgi:hypothetical protein